MAPREQRAFYKSRFGPYGKLFLAKSRPALSLLHLRAPTIEQDLKLLRRAGKRDKHGQFAVKLLGEIDWRPHLVGAVAVYDRPTPAGIAALWTTIDTGSWVTPQLVAVASLVDPHFSDQAAPRLEDLCPIHLSDALKELDPIERHVTQGPAGTPGRSAKMAAALVALQPAGATIDRALAELVAADVDGSGRIATTWRARLVELSG